MAERTLRDVQLIRSLGQSAILVNRFDRSKMSEFDMHT